MMKKGLKTKRFLGLFWVFLIMHFAYARIHKEPYPGFILPSFGNTNENDKDVEDPIVAFSSDSVIIWAVNGDDTLDLLEYPLLIKRGMATQNSLAYLILFRNSLKSEFPSFSSFKKWRNLPLRPPSQADMLELKKWIKQTFDFNASHLKIRCRESRAKSHNFIHEDIIELP